jgi:hypothetical protein
MSDTRWTFGLDPLPQAVELAPLVRRVIALVLSLDEEGPPTQRLIEELREAERVLAVRVPPSSAPRVGAEASPDQRPYLDHSRNVGVYNPCFPEYELVVDGPRATGTVTFPLAFEGPPGIVHGGILATFFDCVVQHHNCDVGVAGKTTSLLIEYRRPTPLEVPIVVEIDRDSDDRRITSRASLVLGDDTLCTATVEAVAGDRGKLPDVGPRIETP